MISSVSNERSGRRHAHRRGCGPYTYFDNPSVGRRVGTTEPKNDPLAPLLGPHGCDTRCGCDSHHHYSGSGRVGCSSGGGNRLVRKPRSGPLKRTGRTGRAHRQRCQRPCYARLATCVISLLPAGPSGDDRPLRFGSQASAGVCPGSRGPVLERHSSVRSRSRRGRSVSIGCCTHKYPAIPSAPNQGVGGWCGSGEDGSRSEHPRTLSMPAPGP